MKKRWLGWHWLAKDRRLRYGARELVEPGKTYTAVGPLVLCANGMHASKRAIDALDYAPGPVVCRVELAGDIEDSTDKSVGRSRRVIWMADATRVLHDFALTVATDALGFAEARGEHIDPRSWKALEVKARWLKGEATDTEIAAAWAAARAAAWDAAKAAARDAAWDAAWDAAKAAARDAARAAAWAAARAAAWDAAKAAAGDAAKAAARDAAWDAARDAAWDAAKAAAGDAAKAAARDAARDAQNQQLEHMLESLNPGRA